MRLLKSIYDRIPTTAFLIALVAIFVTAFLSDRTDRARYRTEHCKQWLEPRGYPCVFGK